MPPWWQPPEVAVPAVLPVVVPLVRAPAVAITVVGAHVYREGLELLIERRMRRMGETHDEWQSKIRVFLETPDWPAEHVGGGHLQYSVIADDEEALANSLFRGRVNVNAQPFGLSVMRTRPGSSGNLWLCQSSEGLWLWPLPAVDHIDLVVRWPAAGIPRASVRIPTSRLAQMSQQSGYLWGEPKSGDAR